MVKSCLAIDVREDWYFKGTPVIISYAQDIDILACSLKEAFRSKVSKDLISVTGFVSLSKQVKEGLSTRQDVEAHLQLLYAVNLGHFDRSSFDHVHDSPVQPCE